MKTNFNFRINAGYLVNATVGVYREFDITEASLTLENGISLSDLVCRVRLSRVQQGILASIEVSAVTELDCVRCLEPYAQKIVCGFDELFAFHQRQNSDADVFLPENGTIDLLPILSEFITLELPISPICSQNCKGLCSFCGANLNFEKCEHTDEHQSD